MNVKDKWTNADFAQMGWHDCTIYSIVLPGDDLSLVLDIDYILEWVLEPSDPLYSFWVAPCWLKFHDCLNLKLNLDFGNHVGLYIDKIVRENVRKTPNGLKDNWDFRIITDHGKISFESTGFEMSVKAPPVYSHSQTVGRK